MRDKKMRDVLTHRYIQAIDTAGCERRTGVSVVDPSPFVMSVPTVTDATCFGANDGSIELFVSGGSTPYSYHPYALFILSLFDNYQVFDHWSAFYVFQHIFEFITPELHCQYARQPWMCHSSI